MRTSTKCLLSLPLGIREKLVSLYTIAPRYTITTPLLNEALAGTSGARRLLRCGLCFLLATRNVSDGPICRRTRKRTGLPNRLTTFTRALLAMCCNNSNELLADGMSANALLCRRLRLCFFFVSVREKWSLRYVVGPGSIQNTD